MAEDVVGLYLAQQGGTATRADLRAAKVTDRQIQRGVAAGLVERVSPGRYALPGLERDRRAAVLLGGVLSHRSAALHHGMPVLRDPKRPEVIVPAHRRVATSRRRGTDLRWRPLPDDDVDGPATSPLRTVLDCARDLPLGEALAVADSALRTGRVTTAELLEAVAALPRTGRARAESVLGHATGAAAGPFESGLRAVSIDAVGPIFVPQGEVMLSSGRVVHPDLVCEELRLVAEADSHEHHTTRSQIRYDCWRYDELSLDGWLVLRFAWEHVMYEDAWSRDVFRRGVTQRRLLLAA